MIGVRYWLWAVAIGILLVAACRGAEPTPVPPTPTPTPTPTFTSTNTPTPTATKVVWPLPDLVAGSNGITTEKGGCILSLPVVLGLNITVANRGNALAGPFVVEVNGVRQTVTSGLAPDRTIALWFALYPYPGEYTAVVDVTSQVEESNEDNNRLSGFLPIPTPVPTCTPTPTPTHVPSPTPTPTLMPTATPGGVPRPFTLIESADPIAGGIVAQASWITTLPDGRRVNISATPPAVRTMPESRQTVWSEGDEVRLVALANEAEGFAFAEWSGDCVGKETGCVLIMDSNKEAVAHFNRFR